MAVEAPTKPVREEPISKVNDEIEVGADLEFQKRWWRFENIVWWVFTCIIVLDFIGAFGHGWLASAEMKSRDGSVDVKYDRIERFSTPSIMTVNFKPASVHDGKVQIWVSDPLITKLGNQQIVPQPESGKLDSHGVLYTFPAGPIADSVKFTLEPKQPGIYQIILRVAGSEQMTANVVVMP